MPHSASQPISPFFRRNSNTSRAKYSAEPVRILLSFFLFRPLLIMNFSLSAGESLPSGADVRLGLGQGELRRSLQVPILEVGRWLRTVLLGHYCYYGVPNNGRATNAFRFSVGRLWSRSLGRRSQKTRINWERMSRIVKHYLPFPKIQHPYPEQRLHVIIQGRSRVW